MSKSSLVPQTYRGNIADCVIALEIASRINVSPLMVMQNLNIINGRPSWSSQFLIAQINASGDYTSIQYEMSGTEGSMERACRAFAIEKRTNEKLFGPIVSMRMAKAEGWIDKRGSKWQTIPELMLRYRAAAFWSRLYCPERGLGMLTREEAEDIAVEKAREPVEIRSEPAWPVAPPSAMLPDPKDDAVVLEVTAEIAPPQDLIEESAKSEAVGSPPIASEGEPKAEPLPSPEAKLSGQEKAKDPVVVTMDKSDLVPSIPKGFGSDYDGWPLEQLSTDALNLVMAKITEKYKGAKAEEKKKLNALDELIGLEIDKRIDSEKK